MSRRRAGDQVSKGSRPSAATIPLNPAIATPISAKMASLSSNPCLRDAVGRIELQQRGNKLTGSLRLKWLSPEGYSGNLKGAVA